MIHDLPGKIIGLIIAFILTLMVPFLTVTTTNEMIERRLIIGEVTTFIDQVVDSRKITDTMLNELNVGLASHSTSVDYEITHYARSVDPDPVNPGEYYITYMVRDNTKWHRGDKISVRVYSIGDSATSALGRKLAGLYIPPLDETLTARIR